jgi:cysteine desulfurase
MRALYMDWNATAPLHPDVIEAMHDAARHAWGNPASAHAVGREARAVVEDAREALALLLGWCARDVVFTSGGTEANNLGLLRAFGGPGEQLRGTCVSSRLEHPSVTRVAEALEVGGVQVVWLDVAGAGRIAVGDVERALASSVATPKLVAVQAVNHETGVIQPIAEIAAVAHRHGAELHVDAVQAVGRLDASAWDGADSLAVSAHKFRGPKGVGALAVRPGRAVRPLLRGGAQERGLRPGTVDLVAAAGLGAAARRAPGGAERYARLAPLRDRLEQGLCAMAERLGAVASVNGIGPRMGHVSNLCWQGWGGAELAAALDLEGLCVSAGSACAAGTSEPSEVITAMHDRERARSSVRVSMGEDVTDEDVTNAISLFERVVARRNARSAAIRERTD